jgi:type II secretory pathway predicted ATPase ExeA
MLTADRFSYSIVENRPLRHCVIWRTLAGFAEVTGSAGDDRPMEGRSPAASRTDFESKVASMDGRTLEMLENPFSDDALDAWIYPSPTHDEALARLRFVIAGGHECGVLVGPPGSGKTRLLQKLADDVRRSGRQAIRIDMTGLNAVRLLVRLDAVMGLNSGGPADTLATWESVLSAIHGTELAGIDSVLLLDHADQAQADAWTLLDQILAQRTAGLTVIVALSPNPTGPAAAFIRRHATLRIELDRLSLSETEGYILTAFERHGFDGAPFTSDAVRRVHALTSGEPRLVNRLCRFALLAASSEGATEIDDAIVESAAAELMLA